MTTTYAPAPATEAQIKFIQSLISDRELDSQYVESLKNLIAKGELRKTVASNAIEHMKSKPWAAKPVATDDKRAAIYAVLDTIPMARYAIPVAELPAMFTEKVEGDLLFIRVSKYRKQYRVGRLHGAPGGFWTSRLGMADVLMLAKTIQTDPAKFTQLFAKHYSVCGSCAAELTDQTSRELGLGPVCRKAFGF